MPEPRIVVLDTPDNVASQGADEFEVRARAAIAEHGRFAVALSGGTTPRAMFALLASPGFAEDIDWQHVHFFWSDERCVAPDDGRSNYGEALKALLAPIEMPASNIHRMRGELDPHAGAVDYCEQLAAFFGDDIAFDLIYLGLGPDGHTASLFPGATTLRVTDQLCAAVHVPDNAVAPWRLTLTYPALNAARCAMFLVEGKEKADVLARVLEGPRDIQRLPAQGVAPVPGTLVWLVDKRAAAQLRSHA
jgi:6-phosphogluconolactonase